MTMLVDPAALGLDDNRWTAGALRHLIAALDNTPVIITIDQDGNTYTLATLDRLDHDATLGDMLVIESNNREMWFKVADIGPAIIPLGDVGGDVRRTAIKSYHAEQTAARELTWDELFTGPVPHACETIRWTIAPGIDQVVVTVTFSSADDTDLGAQWSAVVPLDRLSAALSD
jgi:hypothetical protein